MEPEPRATMTRSEVHRRIDAIVQRIVRATLEHLGYELPTAERRALVQDLSRGERHALDEELGWDGEETTDGN